MKAMATIAIFAALIMLAGAAGACSAATVSTDKETYQMGESITITVTNNCRGPLALNGYWVESEKGERVYTQPVPLYNPPLRPGESATYVWDQRDSKGNGVSAGIYTIGNEYDSAKVTIDDSPILTVTTDKAEYKTGEDVLITLTNEGAVRAVLGGYTVFDEKGADVYSPPMLMFAQYLNPGESHQYVWGQVGYDGNAVPAGSYNIRVQESSVGIGIVEDCEPSASVGTDKKSYDAGEPVVITVTNTGDKTLCVSQGYQAEAADGKIIYTSNVLMYSRPLAPGESASYTWDQTDDAGNMVAPGGYRITTQYGSADIKIKAPRAAEPGAGHSIGDRAPANGGHFALKSPGAGVTPVPRAPRAMA